MRYASITERLASLGSGKWAVHLEARRLAREGIEVIELTIGEPDVPASRALLEVCVAAMYAGRTRYSSGRGEPALTAAIAKKYAARSGRPITPANVLCFPGTQAALFTTMLGLVEAGDEVVVGNPLYATYEGVIRAAGAEPVFVRLRPQEEFRMRADDLEAALTPRSRVLLLNTPHNPTGAVLTQEDVFALGEVCTARDLWIVCDEVYEELAFGTQFASPFDRPELAERTVVASSISKSHAVPGFRSGWLVGPQELCTRLQPISETMLFGSQPFIADMTAAALAAPSAVAAEMRAAYARRAAIVLEELAAVPGLRPMPPQAGMFILVDVSDTGRNGTDFANNLLAAERVAVMPGASFGEAAEDFVRLSLTVEDARLTEACARIARFSRSLTPVPTSVPA